MCNSSKTENARETPVGLNNHKMALLYWHLVRMISSGKFVLCWRVFVNDNIMLNKIFFTKYTVMNLHLIIHK